MHKLIVADLAYVKTILGNTLVDVVVILIPCLLCMFELVLVRDFRLALDNEHSDKDFVVVLALQLVALFHSIVFQGEHEELSKVRVLQVTTRRRVYTLAGELNLDHASTLGEPGVARIPQTMHLANLEHEPLRFIPARLFFHVEVLLHRQSLSLQFLLNLL